MKVTCIMFELTAKRKKKKWVQHETTINNSSHVTLFEQIVAR